MFVNGSVSLSGGQLTFAGSNPFYYDPAKGNLLLDFFDNGAVESGNPVYMFGDSVDTSRVYNGRGTGTPTADNRGLVTTFTYTAMTSMTPEPSSVILLGTGLTALAGLVRRRNRQPV